MSGRVVATEDDVRSWVIAAAEAADDRQADDVVVLEVGALLAITGWFVICNGSNARQVRTIADAVEEKVSEIGGPKPLRVEGRDGLHWVLIDYGDFVVHVFDEETRRFYDLERLWSDVPRIDWQASA